jgi:murein DD-endopeptidase MepM/ murein hydrolase activator NlpD
MGLVMGRVWCARAGLSMLLASLAAPLTAAACALSPTQGATLGQDTLGQDAQMKFVWPAHGLVLFGLCGHKTSVDIAAPEGTDVLAAESGRIAYAGDELKPYGNLILILHDAGWVSAYAFAAEMKVRRGDQVERGQVIATVGRMAPTGQPGLHFELHRGGSPVDALTVLPKAP